MAKKRIADAGSAREFAIAFTIAVTETTSANAREWIAKNGKDSIFALLQEIYPEASNRHQINDRSTNFIFVAVEYIRTVVGESKSIM